MYVFSQLSAIQGRGDVVFCTMQTQLIWDVLENAAQSSSRALQAEQGAGSEGGHSIAPRSAGPSQLCGHAAQLLAAPSPSPAAACSLLQLAAGSGSALRPAVSLLGPRTPCCSVPAAGITTSNARTEPELVRFKWTVWCCVESHYCTLHVQFQLCAAGTPKLCLPGASYPSDVRVSHQYGTENVCHESSAWGSAL